MKKTNNKNVVIIYLREVLDPFEDITETRKIKFII